MTARIDHAAISGTFSLDGETFDVDNNVWVVGDDEECVVIDAPHDIAPILELVGDRRLLRDRGSQPGGEDPALRALGEVGDVGGVGELPGHVVDRAVEQDTGSSG